MKTQVSILMGSDSDLAIMKRAYDTLNEFGVGVEIKVLSAHRTPEELKKYLAKAAGEGVKIFIAAAGGAAHLAGSVAAHSVLPVIGVPIPIAPFHGLDSLLSTVQMPKGIPVLTTAAGGGGAINAAIAAVQILALSDAGLAKKLSDARGDMRKKIRAINSNLEKLGPEEYLKQKKG